MKRIDGKAGKSIVAFTMVCYAVFMWFVIFPTMRIEPLNIIQMKVFNYDDRLLITNAEQIEKFDEFIRLYKFQRTYTEQMVLNGDFPGYKIVLYGDKDYDMLFFAENKKLADKNNVTKDTFQLVP